MSKNTDTRRDEIYRLILAEGSVRVNELAARMEVTTETIRKDLNAMEERGLIVKTHGGAEILNSYYQLPLDVKLNEHAYEKQLIAKAALSYIRDNSIIFLDPGSTTLYLSKYLRLKKGLTVVTNSLAIAEIISETQHDLIIAGGKLQKRGKSTIGTFATHIIDTIVFDTCFLGCDGFLNGPTTFSHEELEVKQHVLKRSETSFLLCDSSKYQKHSTFTFAQCQEFDVMITDAISEKDAAVVKGIANIIVAE